VCAVFVVAQNVKVSYMLTTGFIILKIKIPMIRLHSKISRESSGKLVFRVLTSSLHHSIIIMVASTPN